MSKIEVKMAGGISGQLMEQMTGEWMIRACEQCFSLENLSSDSTDFKTSRRI